MAMSPVRPAFHRCVSGRLMNAPLPCPVAELCESCGDSADLGVNEVRTLVGVLCLTLCRICVEDECTPPLDCPSAVRRALLHAGHLTTTPNGDLS